MNNAHLFGFCELMELNQQKHLLRNVM